MKYLQLWDCLQSMTLFSDTFSWNSEWSVRFRFLLSPIAWTLLVLGLSRPTILLHEKKEDEKKRKNYKLIEIHFAFFIFGWFFIILNASLNFELEVTWREMEMIHMDNCSVQRFFWETFFPVTVNELISGQFQILKL